MLVVSFFFYCFYNVLFQLSKDSLISPDSLVFLIFFRAMYYFSFFEIHVFQFVMMFIDYYLCVLISGAYFFCGPCVWRVKTRWAGDRGICKGHSLSLCYNINKDIICSCSWASSKWLSWHCTFCRHVNISPFQLCLFKFGLLQMLTWNISYRHIWQQFTPGCSKLWLP